MVVDQLPRLGKRELICLLLFTCNYVVSVWRGFLFLWVLGTGYVILLWQSLSLPFNYVPAMRTYWLTLGSFFILRRNLYALNAHYLKCNVSLLTPDQIIFCLADTKIINLMIPAFVYNFKTFVSYPY